MFGAGECVNVGLVARFQMNLGAEIDAVGRGVILIVVIGINRRLVNKIIVQTHARHGELARFNFQLWLIGDLVALHDDAAIHLLFVDLRFRDDHLILYEDLILIERHHGAQVELDLRTNGTAGWFGYWLPGLAQPAMARARVSAQALLRLEVAVFFIMESPDVRFRPGSPG